MSIRPLTTSGAERPFMCLSVTRVSLVKDCSHALVFLDGRFLQTAHRFFLTGLRGLSQDSPAPGALGFILSLWFLHQLRRLPQGRSPCGRLSSPAFPSPVRRALEERGHALWACGAGEFGFSGLRSPRACPAPSWPSPLEPSLSPTIAA